jgi:peptidoglycan/LPS O-acetylase OafA/YrhL
MVFVHHAFRIPLLWAGVDLFFILSGYLITSILLHDSQRLAFLPMLRKFYIRRAERILPAYFVCLLLAWLFFRHAFAHIWGYYFIFLQNVPYAFHLGDPGPLVPLWSLAVEQQFYLIWPVVLFFLPRRFLAPVLMALLVLEPILRAVCTPVFPTSDTIYTFTPFRLDAMAAGALAAVILPHCRALRTIRLAQVGIVCGLLAYAILSRFAWFRRPVNSAAFNSLAYSLNIVILGGFFVWMVLSERSLLTRFLSCAPLRGLGRISYMFYLLHLGVLMLVGRIFSGLTLPAVAFVLTVLLATLSWFALERPVLQLSRNHQRDSPRTPAANA